MDRKFRERLVAVRRAIHQHPELGNQEFRTSALIEKILKKAKIPVKRITKTGLVGIIEGTKQSGPGQVKRVIALRGDMDALPIQEKTGKPYASQRPGIMHACGHDANSTMVLGAALLLMQRREEFCGTVKFVFQPNEESSGGAGSMIAAGVLTKPDVDAIVGIHVSPWLPSGVLGVKPNEMMAAVDRFTVEILGTGGHGAYPHLTNDAIVVAAQVVNALQTVVSRETNPVDPVVITVGAMHGGKEYNIVCDKVTMVGTVRTLNDDVRHSVRRQMEQKIKGVTGAYGAGYTFRYEELGNALRNSADMLELCRRSGERVLGAANIRLLEKPSMGGEDFAEYLQLVPGCFVYIGSAAGKKSFPWHHEKFDIDESVLPRGAELLADIAKRYLEG